MRNAFESESETQTCGNSADGDDRATRDEQAAVKGYRQYPASKRYLGAKQSHSRCLASDHAREAELANGFRDQSQLKHARERTVRFAWKCQAPSPGLNRCDSPPNAITSAQTPTDHFRILQQRARACVNNQEDQQRDS